MAKMEKVINIRFSYHRHDIEWKDFFDERLKPFREKKQFTITYDAVTESSIAFSVYEEELLSSDIIVYFITRKLISLNNFVRNEIPKIISRLQDRGTRVIPVYLENCEWQSINWLHEIRLWPSPQLPFSNMSDEEKEKYISRFIEDELKLGGEEKAKSRYGEGKYGEGPYGGEDVQGEKFNEIDQLIDSFIKFLVDKKGYPSSSMRVVEKDGGVDGRGIDEGIGLYLTIFDYEEAKQLADIEFGLKEDDLTIQMAWQHFMYENRNTASTDIEGYIVFPAAAGLGKEFSIVKFDKDGKGYESLLYEDFPTYEDLRVKKEKETEDSEDEDGGGGKLKGSVSENVKVGEDVNLEIIGGTKTESSVGEGSDDVNVTDFKRKLTDMGKELFDKLIELIRSEPSFVIKAKKPSYINVEIRKPKRVAFQIHRVVDDYSQLGLAIAGWDEDDPEIKNKYAIVRRDIKRLSGLHDTTQENFWLRGKIQSQAKRNFPPYEAKVYIIDPGILEVEEAWGKLRELLQYAKEITGRGKIKEFVSKILKVFGRIATLRSDEVSDVDDLGREILIDAFADTMLHTEFSNGFTLALMGNWGEGKSSVMEILKRKLREREKGRFDFAMFNAWEYEQTDNVGAGLAQEVVRGLKSDSGLGRFHTICLGICFNIIENRWNLLKLGFWGMISWGLYVYLDPLSFSFTGEKLLKESVGTGSLGLGGLLTLNYLIKTARNIMEHPLPTNLEKYFKLPNYAKHLGLIPILQRHIRTLCKLKLNAIRIPVIRRPIGKDRRLLVFVDDLDRCKSDCIAETLDAIRLVMTIPNVIVVICIDHRIAFKAVQRHYRTLAEEDDGDSRSSAEVARDYLGKIIQLPVRLEPVKHEKLKNYVYGKLFRFEREKWEHFVERQEPPDPKDSPAIDRSGSRGNKESEADILGEGRGKAVGVADKGKVSDANALKVKRKKSKKGRKKDDKKSDDKEIEDTPEEGKEFYRLAGLFEFSNPRQLLRLHNSFRFLKALGRDGENDTLDMLRMLFWQEFLHNWPVKVRGRCMATLINKVHAKKVKPIVRRVLNKVRDDIVKLFDGENYAELAEFVRIVVLPHNEEGIFDTKEDINEWLKKEKEAEEKEIQKKTIAGE